MKHVKFAVETISTENQYQAPEAEIMEVAVEGGYSDSSTPSSPSITPGTEGTGSNLPWG